MTQNHTPPIWTGIEIRDNNLSDAKDKSVKNSHGIGCIVMQGSVTINCVARERIEPGENINLIVYGDGTFAIEKTKG